MKYINGPVCVWSKCGAPSTSETNNVPFIKLEFDASKKAAKDKIKSGVKNQNLAMFSVKFKKTEAVEGEEPNKVNAQEKKPQNKCDEDETRKRKAEVKSA